MSNFPYLLLIHEYCSQLYNWLFLIYHSLMFDNITHFANIWFCCSVVVFKASPVRTLPLVMQGAHALSTVRKLLTGLLHKHSSFVFTDITLIIFKNHWGNLVYTNSSIYRRHPVLDMFQKALFNRMRHLKILHQVSCEENY